ncbi:hypothetical protein [Sulfitobacter sp.]|uniref:hypothetical protein n=1 Tax=Sulfitobacter sp. TaxID=1903071 RepID=UPI0030018341
MNRAELNLAERRTIEDLLHRKVKVFEIVGQTNHHRATVYREIKRNYFTDQELWRITTSMGAGAIHPIC